MDSGHGVQNAVTFVVCAGLAFAVLDKALIAASYGKGTEAAELLFANVQREVYLRSATSFFGVFIIGLLSFIQGNPIMAILTCFIQAVSCYADYRVATMPEGIWFDSGGKPLQARRYLNYAITTPTTVFLISRVSDFPPRRIAGTCALQSSVIISGFIASVLPAPWKWLFCGWSCLACAFVMRNLHQMINRATHRRPTHDMDMRGMVFVHWYSAVAWSVFPIIWFLFTFDKLSIRTSELFLVFANFSAKIVYSSSMVYESFDRTAIR